MNSTKHSNFKIKVEKTMPHHERPLVLQWKILWKYSIYICFCNSWFSYTKKVYLETFPLIPSFISFFKEKKKLLVLSNAFLKSTKQQYRCFSMKPWSENIVSNVLTPCLNLNCASVRSELSLDHLINLFLV